VIDNIDRNVGKNTRIVVYAPVAADIRQKFLDDSQERRNYHYRNVSVEHMQGHIGARFQLEKLPLDEAKRVIILADKSAECPEAADRLTLAVILQLRDILSNQKEINFASPSKGLRQFMAKNFGTQYEEDQPVIIPQMLSMGATEVMARMDLKDYIESNRLAGSILSMVSESPETRSIISEILRDDGYQFCIRPLSNYSALQALHNERHSCNGHNGTSDLCLSFEEVSAAAAAKGEIAVGWSAEGAGPSGPWELNPKRRTVLRTVSSTMRIVVLESAQFI